MKICVVCRNISGDYKGSFEFDQALALKEYGHDVYVLSLDLRSIRRRRRLGVNIDTYKGITIMKCSVPVGAVNPKLFDFIGCRAFARAYRKLNEIAGGFDLVNPHFIDISYITLYALRELLKERVPVAATEHSSRINLDREEISETDFARGEYLYRNADRVIAVSGALAEKIKQNFGVDCEVVYNVFDCKIFDGKKRNHDDDDNFTFVSAGNLLPNKRMDLLVRSFARAFPSEPHTRLYIFGDGPEGKRLENLVSELGLEERVFLPGRKPRDVLAEFYEDADVFALVSKRETFGVAYVEAMASGMPVLTCRSGGPEDFVTPEMGIIAESDEESIASAMKKLKANRIAFDDDYTKEYARRICGGEAIAKQLTDIYEKMI